MKLQKGFALIKLMLVAAIIGIPASVAMPIYQGNHALGYAGGPRPAATVNFAYACANNATAYTIAATGTDNVSDFSYGINEADAKGSTIRGGNYAAAPGTNRITGKGGTC